MSRVENVHTQPKRARRVWRTVLQFEHGCFLIRFREIHLEGPVQQMKTMTGEQQQQRQEAGPDFFSMLFDRAIEPVDFIGGSGSTGRGSIGCR